MEARRRAIHRLALSVGYQCNHQLDSTTEASQVDWAEFGTYGDTKSPSG